jgi:3'(2'), 5'-bisphosphate nucleotidase
MPAVTDEELTVSVASTAGELLLTIRAAGLIDRPMLGKAGDEVAHRWIASALGDLRPTDGSLSEEDVCDLSRLDKRRVWIVDSLDGTREFSEGRVDWAVHLALVVDAIPVVAAVASPALGVLRSTADRFEQPEPSKDGPRIAVSRTRPPIEAVDAVERLGGELVPMGSAGYKAMAVLRDEVDAYVHAGGHHEWDSAAPVGVAAEAGLYVSRLDGSELRYNQSDPRLPDVIICKPDVADKLLDAMASPVGATS